MTAELVVALAAICSSLGVGLGIAIGQRRGSEHRETMQRALEEQQAATVEIAAHAKNEERRRIEVVETISEALRERDQWRDLYWEAGLGHSAAQQQMLEEIRRLGRTLSAHKISFRDKSQHFAEIAHNFSGKHGQAGRPKTVVGQAPGHEAEQPKT